MKYDHAIRLADIVISLVILIAVLPFMLLLLPAMVIIQGLPVFYSQPRSGRGFSTFRIFKLRTMAIASEDARGLTLGLKDGRITRLGKRLRKYKIDELPQIVNILIGDMSIVGSRPQVPYYTEKFRDLYQPILTIKPGLLSPSAIQFRHEEALLDTVDNPVSFYETELIPVKCTMDIELARNFGPGEYFRVIWMYFCTLLGFGTK